MGQLPLRRAGSSRRRFLTNAAGVAIGVPLGASALAACSDDDDGFSDDAEAELEQFEGTLVVSTYANPADEAKQALTDAYRERQPGVEIVWETQDFGGPEPYETWLGTQLAAQEIRADIVSGNYAPSFDGYVNWDQFRTTVNPYTGNPWDQDLNFDFGAFRNSQGERIRMATQSSHINWFYNQDMFADAGVSPPQTWDEFAEVCERLSAAGLVPVSMAWSWQWQWVASIYFDQYHSHWVEMTRAQPGDWNFVPGKDDVFEFNPDDPFMHDLYTYNKTRFLAGLRDGQLRYDTDEVAALVENLRKVFPVHAAGDFYVTGDPYAPFLRGNTATMINGGWSLTDLERDMSDLSDERMEELGIEPGSFQTFEWGIFESPSMSGPMVKSGQARSIESATGEYLSVIDKGGEQTRMAVDFVMFWSSQPGYKPYLDAYVAAGEFNPGGPIQISGVELPPELDALIGQVETLGNAATAYNSYWYRGEGEAFQDDLMNLLKTALDGDVTATEYASQLQEYMMDNLDDLVEAAGRTHDDLDNPEREPGT